MNEQSVHIVKVGFPCRIEDDGIWLAQQLRELSQHFSVAGFLGIQLESGFASAHDVLLTLSPMQMHVPNPNPDDISKTIPATALFNVREEYLEAFHEERRKHFTDSGYPAPSF